MIPKTEIYFATRKTASAHVYITKGVGKVRINNVPVEMIPQETAREVILAPLEITGDLREKIDISVRVRGGGFMGQASAAATAITRALVGWTKSKKEPKDHPFPKSTSIFSVPKETRVLEVWIKTDLELHNGIGTSAKVVLPSFRFCMI